MPTPYDFTSEVVLKVRLNDASAAQAFKEIQKKLGEVPINIEFDNKKVLGQISEVEKGLNKSSRAAKDFGDQIVLSGKRFAGYAVASTVLIGISNSFTEATREAIKFGREVGKLRQTFGDQDINTKAILDLSKAYGLSSLKIAETVRVLGQAGGELKNFQNAIKVTEALVQTTLLASFDDLSSSTEAVIALLETFKLTTEDVGKALETINVLSKDYAIEANDLTSAIKRVGGVFAATGGSFEELATLITQVRSTTRESADVIATGFKTIFTSLQRPKTIEYFRDLGIELETSEGKFVGNFKAIELINKGLKDLNIQAGDIKFAEVVEEIGGIRQSSRVIPLLTDFERIQEILNRARSGQGEIASDLIKAQETLANKLDRLKQNFLSFVNDIISNKTFQGLADIFIRAANAAIELGKALNNINIGGFSFILPLLLGKGALTIGRQIQRALPNRIPEILRANSGGSVPGVGNSDTVRALLTPGEYVINKKSAEAFGYGNLDKINRYAKGGIVKFADGGEVKGRKPGAERVKLYEEIKDLEFQILLERNPRVKSALNEQLAKKQEKFDSLPLTPNTFTPDEDQSERRAASNEAFKQRGKEIEATAKASGQKARVAKARKGVLGVANTSRAGKPLEGVEEAKKIAEDFANTLGETGEVVKESLANFSNIIESEAQPKGKRGKIRGSKKKAQIQLNPESATDYTVKHEVAHAADLALGGKGFASNEEGTLQNKISEIIKPALAEQLLLEGQSKSQVTYRTKNEEVFADFLTKADPELRKILTSTTDLNQGMFDIAKYMEKVRETTGRLPKLLASAEDSILEYAQLIIPSNPIGTFSPNKQPKLDSKTAAILDDISSQIVNVKSSVGFSGPTEDLDPEKTKRSNDAKTKATLDQISSQMTDVKSSVQSSSILSEAVSLSNKPQKIIVEENVGKRSGTIPIKGNGLYGGFGSFVSAGNAPTGPLQQPKVYGGFGSFIGAGNNVPIQGPPTPPLGPPKPDPSFFEKKPPKEINLALFAGLATAAGEVTKAYLDEKTYIYSVIDSLTDLATNIAVVATALNAFGLQINTNTFDSFIGSFKNYDFGKLFGKFFGSGNLNNIFPTFSKFGAGLGDITSLAKTVFARVGVASAILTTGFYSLNKVLDASVGYERAKNKAIEEGLINEAGQKAVLAANSELSTNISSVVFGFGTLLVAINPVVGALTIAAAALIKFIAELTPAGQSASNFLRDSLSNVSNTKSTSEIKLDAENQAAINNFNKILEQNPLSNEFKLAQNSEERKNVFNGPSFRNISTALAQQKSTTDDLVRQRRELLLQDRVGSSAGARAERLDKEIEAAQSALKTSAQKAFESQKEIFNSVQTDFINQGGTDFNEFLNSLDPAAKELILLTGKAREVKAAFDVQAKTLELVNSRIRANLNVLSEQAKSSLSSQSTTENLDLRSSRISGILNAFSGQTQSNLNINNRADRGAIAGLSGSIASDVNKLTNLENFQKSFTGILANLPELTQKNAGKVAKETGTRLRENIKNSNIDEVIKKDLLAAIPNEFENVEDIQKGFDEISSILDKAKGPLEKNLSGVTDSLNEILNKVQNLISAASEARRNFVSANFDREQNFIAAQAENARAGSNFSILDLLKERGSIESRITPGADIQSLVNQRAVLQGQIQTPEVQSNLALVNEQIKDQNLLNQQSIVVRQQLIANLKEEMEIEKQRTQAIADSLNTYSIASREERKRTETEAKVAQALDEGKSVDSFSRREKAAIPNALKFLDPTRSKEVQDEIRRNSLRDLTSRGILKSNSRVAQNFASVALTGQTRSERNLQNRIGLENKNIDAINRENLTPLQADANNLSKQLNDIVANLNNNRFNDSVQNLSNLLGAGLKIQFPTEYTINIANNNDLMKAVNDQVKIEVAKAISGQRNGQ